MEEIGKKEIVHLFSETIQSSLFLPYLEHALKAFRSKNGSNCICYTLSLESPGLVKYLCALEGGHERLAKGPRERSTAEFFYGLG